MDLYCVEYKRAGGVVTTSVVVLAQDAFSALEKAHRLFPEYRRQSRGGEVFPCEYVEWSEKGGTIIRRKPLRISIRPRRSKQLPLFRSDL